ncbi:hypothetical protein QUF55_08835 [Clostridiaceae bacterium HSG29]|nr:hypothetical protein [Clostridiaceae bacterium HSG29]
MSYTVHKYNVNKNIDVSNLEKFLNQLSGEVVSIIPNIIPKFHLMGATCGYDYLVIIEKIAAI